MNRAALVLRPWTHGIRRDQLPKMSLAQIDERGHQGRSDGPGTHAKDEAR